MTALKTAFAKAGIELDDAQIAALARLAVRNHPNDLAGAGAELLRRLDGAHLLRALIDGNKAARDMLLRGPLAEARKQEFGGGQFADENYRRRAAAGSEARAAGEVLHPGVSVPRAALPFARSADLRGNARTELNRYLLSLSINGRPLGDVTVAEALAWADAHILQSRFIRIFLVTMPPTARVREVVTEQDAKLAWQQAENADDTR